MHDLLALLAPDAFLPGLALALAIGLLIGVERGWRLREEAEGARVAGIRTFALLGLLGGLVGLEAGRGAIVLPAILVAGAIGALLLGYAREMRRQGSLSATSALAGILTLALGALATTGDMALASIGAGAAVILLASRKALHHAIRLTSETDMKALVRLVLVVFVILPLLPDGAIGPFGALNPRRLWTVVVVTGSISFIGYALVRWLGERRGALVTAAVGALVSSTAVTLDAARRVREGYDGIAAGGAIAIASAVMLVRSLVLVSLVAPFAFAAFAVMVLPGLAVSAVAAAALLYSARRQQSMIRTPTPKPPGLGLAFLFALSVALLSLASAWAQGRWGGNSGAILIALGGTVDIDAAIAAIGALPSGSLPVRTAALALAAPSLLNTMFKLSLFAVVGGGRRVLPGAAALLLVAVSLFVPIALAMR